MLITYAKPEDTMIRVRTVKQNREGITLLRHTLTASRVLLPKYSGIAVIRIKSADTHARVKNEASLVFDRTIIIDAPLKYNVIYYICFGA